MKLKCNDGIVRNFAIAKMDSIFGRYAENSCIECGTEFGINDLKTAKPILKKHSCGNTLQTEDLA